ncbi:MAG: PASTA domain-containing protein [Calditrichae bacterium]|nr:PASTA domain-containing protein [Calditrichota bacterium]MCB9057258.1 PASTA domain-containing protein [Calditrichia bacterium]
MEFDFEQFRQTKLFKILAVILSLFLFTVIMDKIVMPWYVDLGDEIQMPDSVEMSVNDAKAALESHGFHVVIADSVYDAHYSAGTVIDQMPIAYSTVKEGRNVYLTVSIGEKPVIMPNLFGISPRDAELKLNAMNLKLRTTLYAYSDLYPEGAVISQSFPQGQIVQKNTPITITVSLGEKPSQRKIPNLIGKSLSAASQQLEQLGVKVSNIRYEENSSYLPNTVLKQSLPEGSMIGEQPEIELTVSNLEKSE